MLKEQFNKLKRLYLRDGYYNELRKIDVSISSKEIRKEIVELMLDNIDSNDMIIVIDIFLELKLNDLFSNNDLKEINEQVLNIFNNTQNENIAYYLLGYIINNNLSNQATRFKEKINIANDEIKLGIDILNLIVEDAFKKEVGIFTWVGGYGCLNNNINIFKVCEIIRKGIRDNYLKKKLNDTLYNVLNLCDENSNIENVLEFILGIYQDKSFINIDVMKKVNSLMNRVNSKFLENLFIEVCEKCNFNRIMMINSTIKAAARGHVSNTEDLDKLNKYLNITIQNSKKIKMLNLNTSYSANEVLNLLKVNLNKEIDLKELIEKLNIQYYEDEFSPEILGYSFKIKKYNKASIIINKNYIGTDERKRFTLAHEIGHICNEAGDDKFSSDYIYKITKEKEEESKSDKFASELLIPTLALREFYKEDISYDRIEELAKKYKVSLQMACNRVIQESSEGYTFILLKDNKEMYRVFSQGDTSRYGIEEILEYIREEKNKTRKKYYNRCKIDVEIKGRYKYAIINHVYN
ncbi:ImmA/IrrE family metallo-endopeptidase [Clostridium sp.]|uniref:ImmA/IrrE family metallo-endopeptidase n=1 Tax=Clostridium sp. TaxID=1506 RepID=UPI003991988B